MEPTKKKEEAQEERVKRLAEEQLGPYRKNAKPKELPKFWINIVFIKDDDVAHSFGFTKGRDRLHAYEKFLATNKILQADVLSQTVVGLKDFDDDYSE